MAVEKDDVWAMWALWHWRSGIVGAVYGRRRNVKANAIGTIFIDEDDYRRNVGVKRPYKLVKVDVTRVVTP